jgi:signal transduction histidine kinase/DNA-binding response OmpR family regulator
MPAMRPLLQKAWIIIKQNAQVLIVWAAFTLMVVLSSLFVDRIVRRQLVSEAETSLTFMQAKIESDLQEPQTLMLSIADVVRGMILQGCDSDTVHDYVKNVSGNVIRNEKRALGVNGLFGVFDVFGGLYLNDSENIPSPGYVPRERPWYKAAVEADGEITLTDPYLDERTGTIVLSCAQRVFDDRGNPLCVLALDIPLDRISDHIAPTKLADGGYSLLFDKKLNVIAHPVTVNLGKHLREWNSGLVALADDLERIGGVSERRVNNYLGADSVVFIRSIINQWFLGIVTPYNMYYRNVTILRTMLILAGFTLSASLSFIFLRISQAKARADMKNRQKSNFLARMSHEIRTPMNAILGIAEIELQDETLPQSAHEAFARIGNSGDLLIGIINDILDLSKIEAGKLELTSAKYDIPSLIHDTVQLNILHYGSKPIEFKLDVDENIPVSLVGDELRIKQILNNLLSNAFKYTEKGEVSFSIAADYAPRGGAINVPLVFRVCDTGQGMTAEQVRTLGSEYSRFNLESNRTTQGTGLGMSITIKLIQMMNGEFSIDSKPGKGTAVTVRLPQRNDGIGVSGTIGREQAENFRQLRSVNTAHMKKTAQMAREYMPYGRVLIVDDVESNLYVARGLMVPYGLSIETAVSGFEAVDKIKRGGSFDIIFMDHMMPKMDGIEAARIIRGLGYKNPIVALTANALTGQAEMFRENGFAGFISKPIDMRQLNQMLNKLIRDKQGPDTVEAARRRAADLKTAIQAEARPALDPELAEIFAKDAEKALERLEAAHAREYRGTDDIQQYAIDAHSMKSVLANIGETGLSAAALKLEQTGRAGDTKKMTAETPAFLEGLRKVIEKVKPKEDGGDASRENTGDEAYLNEKLRAVQTACENYDAMTANTALAELRKKNWPPSAKELLDTLAVHLLQSDFEEAAKLAESRAKGERDGGC